jgi:glycosyltransferase involved in cell wall biosynthesis
MTYNHARYIEDALAGFSSQVTDFPFVAVIVDDASTDSNQAHIMAYYCQHFNLEEEGASWKKEDEYARYFFARHRENANCYFAILLLKINQFGKSSKGEHIKEWVGNAKFIALCEGDDFWIDPYKLQKEVDLLSKNNELMGVVTNSMIVDKEGKTISAHMDNIVPHNQEGRYSLHDYFKNVHHYPTATILYRNDYRSEVNRMRKHTKNKFLGDWTLWAILHSFGDFYYLDEVTSAYRINPTSLTHSVDRVERAKANLSICQSLSEVLPAEYSPYLKKAGWMYFSVFMAYRKERKWFKMMSSLLVCFFRYPAYTIKRLIHVVQGKDNN